MAGEKATTRLAKDGKRVYLPVMTLSNTLVPVAIVAVAVVLVLGLVNMMRGGSANTSQRLMQLRVQLQFVAILIILFVLWWRSGG